MPLEVVVVVKLFIESVNLGEVCGDIIIFSITSDVFRFLFFFKAVRVMQLLLR